MPRPKGNKASETNGHQNGGGDDPPNGGDDSDEEMDMAQAAENPAQRAETQRRRREIRCMYRNLIEKTTEDDLTETLQSAEQIFPEVKNTREAALDSQLMAVVANLARQKAQRFNTNLVTFEPVEYAIKIMSFMSDDQQLQEDACISVQGWEKLGEAVQPFFKRAPPLQLMYGTFKAGPREVNRPIKPRPPKDDLNAKKTVPEHVKSFKGDSKANEEGTTEQVEKILGHLKRYCYEQNKGDPLCYFEFIVNPHSFSQTIENMFYVSFLINEGHAKIMLDADKLPLIAPTSEEAGNGQKEEGGRRKQVVMSLTKKEWQEIIAVFGITAPLIPSR